MKRCTPPSAWRSAAPALLLLLTVLAACTPRSAPVLEPLRDREPRTPVVLIPGITGTQLRDSESGKVLWGNARSVFLPRDGGYGVALPIDPRQRLKDRIEAPAAIRSFRVLGIVKVDVYASLVRLMEANGYRLGDPQAPARDDTFFLFPYDWRRSSVEAAADLAGFLERLRLARDEERLKVHLICQSDASRIARYLVRYGGGSLEQAEAGTSRPLAGVEIEKVIMVGAANGGALRILLEMNRGRSYVPWVGRKFSPEMNFTFPSLYEALPAYRRDLFFDDRGEPLDVDLFDAGEWKRYGWSVFDRDVARRIDRRGRTDLFGETAAQRESFVQGNLDRAVRVHRLLRRDEPTFPATRFYQIQNAYEPTSDRALLSESHGRWRTRFNDDRRVRKDPYLSSRASAPGDRHATLDSQMWLSDQERRAIAHPPIFVDEQHRKIILSPAAHRYILAFLND